LKVEFEVRGTWGQVLQYDNLRIEKCMIARPDPDIHDMTGGAVGTHYEVCWEQSDIVIDRLDLSGLNYQWVARESSSALPPHYWVDVIPQNVKSAAAIKLDPLYGTTSIIWNPDR
jgi:hypothetical protein